MGLLNELKELKYWIHIAIIAFVVLFLLQIFTGGQMLTIHNFLWSIPLVFVGDFVAHLILKYDL